MHLPKSGKGDLWKEEREEERELAPQETPRVFWLVLFVFLLLLLLELLELKLRLDFWPDELAERDEFKLISGGELSVGEAVDVYLFKWSGKFRPFLYVPNLCNIFHSE